MPDRTKSVELLNKAVGLELQAILQYMYWHIHLDDQGFDPLAKLMRQTAISEMIHTEQLAERILFLKGDVDMEPAGPVEKSTDPEMMIEQAMQMEQDAVVIYNQYALECAANADSGTKQVFEEMVTDEEGHFDLFEKQLDNIKRFGLSYLALQSFNVPPTTGPGSQ